MNILEFPSHICASGEDIEIINLIKDFFEETMCLYNIIELEQLFDSLKVKTHSKENFEVIVDCQDASTLEKLKSVYNNTDYTYYGKNIHVSSSKEGDSLLMQFKMLN